MISGNEDVWYMLLDATTDKVFYANPIKDKCRWSRPSNGRILYDREGELPPWWEMYDATSQSPYYFNNITQQTYWSMPSSSSVHPVPLTSEDDSFLRGKLKEEPQPLEDDVKIDTDGVIEEIGEKAAEETVDKNWEEHEDPRTGYKYYLHRRTKKLTWSMMEAFHETLKEEDTRKKRNSIKMPTRLPPTPPSNTKPKCVPLEPISGTKPQNPKPESRKPLTQNTIVPKSPPKRPPSNSFSQSNSNVTIQVRAPAKSFSETPHPKPNNPPPPIPKGYVKTPITSKKAPLRGKFSPKVSGQKKFQLPPRPNANRPKFSRVNTVGSTSSNHITPKNIVNEPQKEPTVPLTIPTVPMPSPKVSTKFSPEVINNLELVVKRGMKTVEVTDDVSSTNQVEKSKEHNPRLNRGQSSYPQSKKDGLTSRFFQRSFSFVSRKTLSPRDTNPPRPKMTHQLKQQLNSFQLEGFAEQYFKNVKKGVFRRTVPMRDRLKWTKDSLKDSLLKLNKKSVKIALSIFKHIQIYMGDKSPSTSDEERYKLVEEYITFGVNMAELRDEIYCQLCKQTTLNPNEDSLERGWALISIAVQFFPPTKNLEPFIQQYIQEASNSNEKFKGYINFSLKKLSSIARQGVTLRTPEKNEIEHLAGSALRPPVFFSTVEEINSSHQVNGELPKIVVVLLEKLNALNAHQVEGIFRIPGSVGECTRMRIQIEKGDYNLDSFRDPHVPASVLKFWFRSLEDPIIPSSFYWKCVECTKTKDIDGLVAVIKQFPTLNFKILSKILSYLKLLAQPENQQHTKMGLQNIAIVFAPSFIRCPSPDPGEILSAQQYEQQLMMSLLKDISI